MKDSGSSGLRRECQTNPGGPDQAWHGSSPLLPDNSRGSNMFHCFRGLDREFVKLFAGSPGGRISRPIEARRALAVIVSATSGNLCKVGCLTPDASRFRPGSSTHPRFARQLAPGRSGAGDGDKASFATARRPAWFGARHLRGEGDLYWSRCWLFFGAAGDQPQALQRVPPISMRRRCPLICYRICSRICSQKNEQGTYDFALLSD